MPVSLAHRLRMLRHLERQAAEAPSYFPDTMAIARAALARGPLVRDRHHWRFGRRLFNGATVNALLASGDAVRDGQRVIAAAGGGCAR